MTYAMVSIILPVYRQALAIDLIVRDFESELASLGIDHETILVANGPDDGSLSVCSKLELDLSDVRLIAHEGVGWGSAVKRGIHEARGDLLCYTNSARTNIKTLTLMLDFAMSFPGIVVKANRKTRDSVWRHLGSLLYNLECRAMFDLSNFDINGTPKIFARSLDTLLTLSSDDDLIDVEFLAICRRDGHLVLEVPVVLTDRRGGVSTTNIQSAFRMYLGAARLARRMRVRRRAAARL